MQKTYENRNENALKNVDFWGIPIQLQREQEKMIKLIVAADLHLGRNVRHPLFAQQSCVVLAWQQLVEKCIRETPPPDALLLAGDIIDDETLFFENYPFLKEGIIRLVEHQIPVVAILGNHDGTLGPKLKRLLSLEGFTLLGLEKKWERISLLSKTGSRFHIDGCSFNGPFMHENPLSSYSLSQIDPKEPLIGLLHCDLDAPSDTPYAPVKALDFNSLPHKCWVLGHIHTDKRIKELPYIFYCGSLQGLDVTEDGPHGSWSLLIHGDGSLTCERFSLAPLQWENVALDLSENTLEEWEVGLQQEFEKKLLDQIGASQKVDVFMVRLFLRGRTALFRPLQQHLSPIIQGTIHCANGGRISYFIESIKNETRPAIDLPRIAEGHDLPAILARILLTAENESVVPYTSIKQLLQRHPFLKQSPEAWPNEEEVHALLLQQGYALLDELLAQKGQ